MSTYWDVVCLDCGEDAGLHLNHGSESLRALIAKREPLAALADAEVDIKIIIPGERGYVKLEFFKKHVGHVIAPVNEYGDINGDCNELHMTGPYSTDGARCRLPEHHEGDHDFRRASRWEEDWRAVRLAAAERRRMTW